MKRLTDPTFKYTPADHTDIRKTFERVRRELEAQRPKAEEVPVIVGKVYNFPSEQR